MLALCKQLGYLFRVKKYFTYFMELVFTTIKRAIYVIFLQLLTPHKIWVAKKQLKCCRKHIIA